MIILEKFIDRIPPAAGDNRALQLHLLHYLFPLSFGLEQARTEREKWRHASYKLVAADGLDIDPQKHQQLEKGMEWLTSIEIPEEMLSHPEAIFGIAVGIGGRSNPAWMEWWRKVIRRLEDRQAESEWVEMLKLVSGLPGAALQLSLQNEYALAGPLFAKKQQWDSTALAQYFNTMRKRVFPYYERDFLRDMLAVYLMDFALEISLNSSAMIEEASKNAVQLQMERTLVAIHRATLKTARLRIGIASLFLQLTSILACALIFVGWSDYMTMRSGWDTLKWIFLTIGGPIAMPLFILGHLYFLIKGKGLSLDLISMHAKYQRFLEARMRRKLKLPSLP